MPRTRYTLEDLRTRLHERVGNNYTFWKPDEVRDALNEAISFWQALTGEWTTEAQIEAKSNSPSFYPVPKQIVSLTRVGIASEDEALNPLGGTILPNRPVYETSEGLYHTATGVPIVFTFVPTGGVSPYRIVWNFEGVDLPVENDLSTTYTFLAEHVPSVTISATVTDTAGDVFVAPFELRVENHVIVTRFPWPTPWSFGTPIPPN
jgi:hypothetical protein